MHQRQTQNNPQPGNFSPTQLDPKPVRYDPHNYGRTSRRSGSIGGVVAIIILLLALGVYFFFPARTMLLILGMDRPPVGTAQSRTDTIILTGIDPWQPQVSLLSIPRDLWVNIPGVGENRINTAHFFAEINQAGSGPGRAQQTVESNFGVSVPFYFRFSFDGFEKVIDALGGIDLNLPATMGGLTAGQHHLNGTQALAFVRDRKGTDDFFRMQQGQVMFKAVTQQLLTPAGLAHVPAVLIAIGQSTSTNLPVWLWPRLGVALLRAGSTGINNQAITREMATPFITSQGADVLLPQWNKINPLVKSLFP